MDKIGIPIFLPKFGYIIGRSCGVSPFSGAGIFASRCFASLSRKSGTSRNRQDVPADQIIVPLKSIIPEYTAVCGRVWI